MYVCIRNPQYLQIAESEEQLQVNHPKPNPMTCWHSLSEWLLSSRGSTLLENRKGHVRTYRYRS